MVNKLKRGEKIEHLVFYHQMGESGVLIERKNYPALLSVPGFPPRFSLVHMLKARELIADPVILSQYDKWRIGVSYETGRLLKIGGEKHIELGRRFYICGYLFITLANTDIEEYERETEQLWAAYTKRCAEIHDYNIRLHRFYQQLRSLTSYWDYVEFEGRRYGFRLDKEIRLF